MFGAQPCQAMRWSLTTGPFVSLARGEVDLFVVVGDLGHVDGVVSFCDDSNCSLLGAGTPSGKFCGVLSKPWIPPILIRSVLGRPGNCSVSNPKAWCDRGGIFR